MSDQITIEEVHTFLKLAGQVPKESLTASECVGLRAALLAVDLNEWIKNLLNRITDLARLRDEADANHQAAHESLVNAERDLGHCREIGNSQRAVIERLKVALTIANDFLTADEHPWDMTSAPLHLITEALAKIKP